MGRASQSKLRGHFLNPAKSLAFGLVRSAAFGELLGQPGRLATARAFAPRLAVRTREGLARADDLGTQRFAPTLRFSGFACLVGTTALPSQSRRAKKGTISGPLCTFCLVRQDTSGSVHTRAPDDRGESGRTDGRVLPSAKCMTSCATPKVGLNVPMSAFVHATRYDGRFLRQPIYSLMN